MRVALIAMPWNAQRLPSPAAGFLAAFLREKSEHMVDCLNEYVEVSLALGGLYEPLSRNEPIGELIYAAHLYPQNKPAIEGRYVRWAREYDSGITWARGERYPWPEGEPAEHFEHICRVTGAHLDALAAQLAQRYDVLGFTTTCCQLFASLAVACRLKALNPEARVVLGGAGVDGEASATVIRTFPWVDHVVQGQGEARLLALLQAIEARREDSLALEGVLSRIPCSRTPSELASEPWNRERSFDSLPVPDFGEYHELAERHALLKWSVPIEGIRGCGSKGSTRPHKSGARVAAEVKTQSDRYENVRFLFLDHEGLDAGGAQLAGELERQGKTLGFFHNLDVRLHPYDVLRLWEAGCSTVRLNIDGLSAAFLRRIGSPGSLIASLQALRTCYELGLNNNHCTLLTDFPGSSEQEILETAENIRRFAIVFQPLEPQRFRLSSDSFVCEEPRRFGIANLRNGDDFEEALPPEVWRSLKLRWLDYDSLQEPADWSPVRRAVDDWRELHQRLLVLDGVDWFLGTRPLYYYDGGSFLKVIDRRTGHRELTLDPLSRDAYLYCTEIRTREQVEQRLGRRCPPRDVAEILEELLAQDLMFAEGDALLSLAVAYRIDLAVTRIRKSRAEDAPA